jgi:tetratricopeptide repeat protein
VRRLPAVDDEVRAAALNAEGMARLELRDLDGAVAVAEQDRAAATAAGDRPALSRALVPLAMAESLRANLGRARELIDEAARLADQRPERRGYQYSLHLIRGTILLELDRPDEARHTLEAGRRTSEELGVRWPLPWYQAFLGMERFVAGE